MAVAEEAALGFAGLLRRLREEARLTRDERAAAAGLAARSVSDLERGIRRTARKDTARLLADALSLTGPAGELFVAAARGKAPAAAVLAAADGAGPMPLGAGAASPYRGLGVFAGRGGGVVFGRGAAALGGLGRIA